MGLPDAELTHLAALAVENTPEPYAFTPGGSFILDTPPDPEPLWGAGSEVLLADGEALIIAGGQGLGKTTLAQQLALGRCGFGEYADLLGWPIKPGEGRTLYLAMDRPRQAARSFRRMVGDTWRADLDDRLAVWQGPPPADLAKFTGLLLDICRKAGADTVIVDSLKDAAVGLPDDEVGAGYNLARQTAVAAGVHLVELHHNRKSVNGAKGTTAGIDDLYGSTWLPSGAGSVLLLTGAPGDPIVGLHHLKQPAAEVGPLRIIHDHDSGRSSVWREADVLSLAASLEGSPPSTSRACCTRPRSRRTARKRRPGASSRASNAAAPWYWCRRVRRAATSPRKGGSDDLHGYLHGHPFGRTPAHTDQTYTLPRAHAQETYTPYTLNRPGESGDFLA